MYTQSQLDQAVAFVVEVVNAVTLAAESGNWEYETIITPEFMRVEITANDNDGQEIIDYLKRNATGDVNYVFDPKNEEYTITVSDPYNEQS